MTGPFTAKDFEHLDFYDGGNYTTDAYTVARTANAIDAKRWACEKGWEHEIRLMNYGGGNAFEFYCTKCTRDLKPRWEAV